MDRKRVLALVRAGLKSLNDDVYLLKKNVNERTITAKLGSYLQGHLPTVLEKPDYLKSVPTDERLHVDCEFNKHGDDTKRILWEYEIIHPHREDLYYAPLPDVILHRRGLEGPNILSLEVKKNFAQPDGMNLLLDKMKIVGYVGPNLRYAFGLYLCLALEGESVHPGQALLTTREAVDKVRTEEANELQKNCLDLVKRKVNANGRVYIRHDLTPHEDELALRYCSDVEKLYSFADVRSELT